MPMEYRCEECGRILDVPVDKMRPWARSVPVCPCQLDILSGEQDEIEELNEKLETAECAKEEAEDILLAMEHRLSQWLEVPTKFSRIPGYALRLSEDPEDLLLRLRNHIRDYYENY